MLEDLDAATAKIEAKQRETNELQDILDDRRRQIANSEERFKAMETEVERLQVKLGELSIQVGVGYSASYGGSKGSTGPPGHVLCGLLEEMLSPLRHCSVPFPLFVPPTNPFPQLADAEGLLKAEKRESARLRSSGADPDEGDSDTFSPGLSTLPQQPLAEDVRGRRSLHLEEQVGQSPSSSRRRRTDPSPPPVAAASDAAAARPRSSYSPSSSPSSSASPSPLRPPHGAIGPRHHPSTGILGALAALYMESSSSRQQQRES